MTPMQQALSWFQAQPLPRQWRLAAASSVLLCVVAAAVLYLIHLTTPSPLPGLSRKPPAGSDAAAVFARRAAGPVASPGPVVQAASDREPAANETSPGADAAEASVVPAVRAPAVQVPTAQAPARRPSARATSAQSAAPSLAAARRPRLAGAPVHRATLAGNRAPSDIRPTRAGRDRPPLRAARVVVSRPLAAATKTPQPTADVGITPVADSSAEMTRGLVTAALAPPSTARAPQRSLHAAMVGECVDTAFLNRFICEQRVRLGYCRDRWNQHADCMVDPPPGP